MRLKYKRTLKEGNAVSYLETHISPRINCAWVLCMHKRKEENSKTLGVEASF